MMILLVWPTLLVAWALPWNQLLSSQQHGQEQTTSSFLGNHVKNGIYLGGAVNAERILEMEQKNKKGNGTSSSWIVLDCRRRPGGFYFHDLKSSTLEEMDRTMDTLKFLASQIHVSVTDRRRQNDQSSILVHCQAGQNRAPASLATYFMLYENMTLSQSLRLIEGARRKANTIENTFILELRRIENGHRRASSAASSNTTTGTTNNVAP